MAKPASDMSALESAEAYADIAAGRVISGDEALERLDHWSAGDDIEESALS